MVPQFNSSKNAIPVGTTTIVAFLVSTMLVAMASASQSVLAQGNADELEKQLNAWKAIFDGTNGENWDFCTEFREDPCGCNHGPNKRIACDSNGFIEEMILQGNGLEGTFPETELMQIFQLGVMKKINFQRNDGLTGVANCSDVQSCHEQAVTCLLPTQVNLCPPLDRSQWKQFYDTLGGSEWERCAGDAFRENPCDCDTGPNRKLECANGDGGYITKIILRNNNFQGTEFPASILNEMLKHGELHEIELGNNDNFEADGCVVLPGCLEEGVTCNLPQGVEVCELEYEYEYDYETPLTTAAPTTAAPTTEPPTTEPPTTEPPTTEPPTTEPPTTAAPTTEPPTTAVPTTATPTTNAPSSPPPSSNPPTTTAAPSASSRDPETKSPTTEGGSSGGDSSEEDGGSNTASGAPDRLLTLQTRSVITVVVGIGVISASTLFL